jgi:hypothetical protein
MKQNAKKDFAAFAQLLQEKTPFTFIRFSDGEMEVINNHRLLIREGKIIWSKGEVSHNYPSYDHKDFDPKRDQVFRKDLISSAKKKSDYYFKGIPATHNNATDERNKLIEFNEHSKFNLTFSDLLINENYMKFRRKLVPIFESYESIFIIANFRSNVNKHFKNANHLEIPDNFFQDYANLVDPIIIKLSQIPSGSLVLSSASSLSNVIGWKLHEVRQDITFIDIGTSMHDLIGLDLGIRQYHAILLSNSPRNLYKKARLIMSNDFRMKW